MEFDDVKVGDSVVTMVNNVKVHGAVESIQLAKKLIDVKIYQPGHTHHCLIVARPAEQVTLAEDDDESEPLAASSGITEADLKKFMEHFMDHLEKRFDAFDQRIAELSGRVDALEGKKKQENQDEPLPGDRAESA